MEDQLDLELRQHALEQAAIEDRAGDLALDPGGNRGVETRDVERDDRAMRLPGETLDQPVADLAAGAGNQDDRFCARE
jgi:hypothetical protein